MAKKNKLTYIACSNWGAFLDYKKDHPNLECEYISSVTFLEGRKPADILMLDSLEERWDGIGIQDCIERFQIKHEAYYAESTLEEEIKDMGLTDEDLELGV